jgi:hypothetical protein
METSTAVPQGAERIERSLADLSDDDLEHLAQAMTRSWRHENRLGLLIVLLPFGGCAGLVAVAGEAWLGEALALGGFALLAGALAGGIAGALFRRSLALEVESLGYDAGVARAVLGAYQRALRSFLPRLTRRQKLEACMRQLATVRGRALPSRER